jgi:hypothetical protein
MWLFMRIVQIHREQAPEVFRQVQGKRMPARLRPKRFFAKLLAERLPVALSLPCDRLMLFRYFVEYYGLEGAFIYRLIEV